MFPLLLGVNRPLRVCVYFPAAPTTEPDNNAPVRFTALFTNSYDNTISDVDDFIETFRREFCDDTGVSCTRLKKPFDEDDIQKVTVKES